MRGLRILCACALIGALLGTLLGAPVAAQTQQADLIITQPSYVEGDVEETTEDGTRIYQANGEELLIRVENADQQNITRAAVQNGPGSISFDPTLGLFRFTPDGQPGSSTLVFTIARGGSTVEARAVLQTEQVRWAHRGADRDEQLREQADKWQQVADEAGEVNPDENAESVVSDALTYARFLQSPLQGLTDSLQGALIVLAFTPGGWIISAIFLGLSLIGVASGMRYRNRTQKQLADFGDIQIEQDKAFLEKVRSRLLQQNDWNQLFPDDVARANRDLFGRNVWQGAKQFSLLWSPRSVKGTVLQMMGQTGYVGYAVENEDGTLLEASVAEGESSDGPHEPDADGHTVEQVNLATLDFTADAAFIDALDWTELDDSVFQMDRDTIDIDEVHLPVSNREIDDAAFMEAVNPNFPDDFEDEEHFAAVCRDILDFVIEHDHTDELGTPHTEMDLLSYLSEMSSVLADDGGFPAAHYQRQTFMWCAENIAVEDEAREAHDAIVTDAAGASGGGQA